MLVYTLLSVAIIAILVWLVYVHLPPAPARISQTVAAYDNQYELFRDMEPNDQTRENSWVGFLQENVRAGRTGPIGDFIGNDSDAGNARLYTIGAIQEPTMDQSGSVKDSGGKTSRVVLVDSVTGARTEFGPGTYPLTNTTTSMEVFPPLVVVIENPAGIKQTTKYVKGDNPSRLTIDQSYKFNKITLSLP